MLGEEEIEAITLPVEASKFGAVESLADAHKCADLFKAHRDDIDGVLVTLPNFGDERAVANTLRWAGLNVPVLIHAFNDDGKKMTLRVHEQRAGSDSARDVTRVFVRAGSEDAATSSKLP